MDEKKHIYDRLFEHRPAQKLLTGVPDSSPALRLLHRIDDALVAFKNVFSKVMLRFFYYALPILAALMFLLMFINFLERAI